MVMLYITMLYINHACYHVLKDHFEVPLLLRIVMTHAPEDFSAVILICKS